MAAYKTLAEEADRRLAARLSRHPGEPLGCPAEEVDLHPVVRAARRQAEVADHRQVARVSHLPGERLGCPAAGVGPHPVVEADRRPTAPRGSLAAEVDLPWVAGAGPHPVVEEAVHRPVEMLRHRLAAQPAGGPAGEEDLHAAAAVVWLAVESGRRT